MSNFHDVIDRTRWRAVRRRVLERDQWRCQTCGRAGRLEVDHVIPLSRGGAPYDLTNLAARCGRCHYRKTAAENRETTRAEYPAAAAWRDLVDELLTND